MYPSQTPHREQQLTHIFNGNFSHLLRLRGFENTLIISWHQTHTNIKSYKSVCCEGIISFGQMAFCQRGRARSLYVLRAPRNTDNTRCVFVCVCLGFFGDQTKRLPCQDEWTHIVCAIELMDGRALCLKSK